MIFIELQGGLLRLFNILFFLAKRHIQVTSTAKTREEAVTFQFLKKNEFGVL